MATHLVGGGLALKWLGGNNYEITLRLLRDCLNGTQVAYNSDDDNMVVGIFDLGTNFRMTKVTLVRSTKTKLDFQGDKCVTKINACTDITVYSGKVVLNPATYNNTKGYYISWERCCRNSIISNLTNPGAAAETYYMEFPSPKKIPNNSTPYFTANPNTLLCANNYFRYNMKYVDDDGDDLKYKLVDPLNGNLTSNNPSTSNPGSGPYKPVQWAPGYSSQKAILGAPPLSIDPATGWITVYPSSIGIFVAAILVEEYRFGVKIGETYLELQFSVVNCPNDPPAVATVNDTTNKVLISDTIHVKVPGTFCFKINASDIQDSVFLTINTPALSDSTITAPTLDTFVAGNKTAVSRVCWNTQCSFPKHPIVPFYISVSDNGCPIPRTEKQTVYLLFDSIRMLPGTDILCLELLNNAITVKWGDSTSDSNPLFHHYYIYRNANGSAFEKIDSIYTKTQRSYTDMNAVNNANINYGYFIVSSNECNDFGYSSDTMYVSDQLAAKLNAQWLQFVTVIPGDTSVLISWPQTHIKTFSHYSLYRETTDPTKPIHLKTTNHISDTTFIDSGLQNDERSYCYYVMLYDTCGHESEKGKIACTILLDGHVVETDRHVNWTNYIGWESGVLAYDIVRGGGNSSFSSIHTNVGTALSYIDASLFNDGLMYYYVLGKENKTDAGSSAIIGGPFSSRSNDIQLSFVPTIFFPNAFTANNDSINDVFRWKQRYIKDFSLDIYNRWGVQIYHTNDKDGGWDGKIDGQPAQQDVYFYVVHYSGWDGTDESTKGTITLLR